MEEVYCEFKYSRAAAAFLALAVGATLALVVFVPYPDEVRAAAFGLVVALASRAHRHLCVVDALRMDAAGAIAVRDSRGEWRAGVVVPGSFVAPWLTIVHWRPEGARFMRVLTILPDMASGEARRRIRVLLRFGG